MKIAVFGLGYVGLTAAACLAKQGHTVLGFDVNETKVADVNRGVCPIVEPGLPELIKTAAESGALVAHQEIGSRLEGVDLVIVCVGTPSLPDGSHNMGFILEVTRQIAAAVARAPSSKLTIAYRSTFRPGTMEQLILPVFTQAQSAAQLQQIELVYYPEFLRESTAIADYFAPPKVVVGTADGSPSATMDAINQDFICPKFNVAYRTAEVTKFIDNTWHALKVAFANEMGRVCTEAQVSTTDAHAIFVSDTKLNISAYYMRPGNPFGGSCLPKDLRALCSLADRLGVSAPIIQSIISSNESHKTYLSEHVRKQIGQKSKRILLIGISFKKDSDDLRESPYLDLAADLLEAGHKLSILDEGVLPEKLIGQNLGYASSHFPELASCLIPGSSAEATAFDFIVDAHTLAAKYDQKNWGPVISIGRL